MNTQEKADLLGAKWLASHLPEPYSSMLLVGDHERMLEYVRVNELSHNIIPAIMGLGLLARALSPDD